MLDVYLLRLLGGAPVEASDAKIASFIARFVRLGLALLWVSGLGMIFAAPLDPLLSLTNPKLQAKLAIVLVLTLNAVVIEVVALPFLAQQQGRCLFSDVGGMMKTVLLASAAVSTVSWLAPFLLGMARELNHVVPAAQILAVYGAVLASAIIIAQVAGRLLDRPRLPHASRSAVRQIFADVPEAAVVPQRTDSSTAQQPEASGSPPKRKRSRRTVPQGGVSSMAGSA